MGFCRFLLFLNLSKKSARTGSTSLIVLISVFLKNGLNLTRNSWSQFLSSSLAAVGDCYFVVIEEWRLAALDIKVVSGIRTGDIRGLRRVVLVGI